MWLFWQTIRAQQTAPQNQANGTIDGLASLKDEYQDFLQGAGRHPDFKSFPRLEYEVIRGNNLVKEITEFIALEHQRTARPANSPELDRAASNARRGYEINLREAWMSLESTLENRALTQVLMAEPAASQTIQPSALPAPLLTAFGPDLTLLIRLPPDPVTQTGGAWADTLKVFYLQGQAERPLSVAIKRWRLLGVGLGLNNPDEIHSIAREISLSLRLRHPNIMPFMGSTYLINSGRPHVRLVGPWMMNGDAAAYVRRTSVDLETVLNLLHGVATGLEFLHAQNPPVVHGDVKGQNVLIDDNGIPKLADFGFARYIDLDLAQSSPSASRGTTSFQAPERLYPNQFNLTTMGSWTPKADVFSFGMTCFQLLSRQLPYAEIGSVTLIGLAILEGRRPDIPDDWRRNQELVPVIEVMRLCWRQNRDERPHMREVVQRLA